MIKNEIASIISEGDIMKKYEKSENRYMTNSTFNLESEKIDLNNSSSDSSHLVYCFKIKKSKILKYNFKLIGINREDKNFGNEFQILKIQKIKLI